jgi:hypothetical protein
MNMKQNKQEECRISLDIFHIITVRDSKSHLYFLLHRDCKPGEADTFTRSGAIQARLGAAA